jgi:hypothetical protein
MPEIDLGLQFYDWDEDGGIADKVCPFCLDVLSDDDDPEDFWEPTECCHACCWQCSKMNPEGGWCVCPACAPDCTENDLLTWDRSTRSWNGTYKNWTVRVFVREDHSCVGTANSPDGQTANVTTSGCVDEVWYALVEEIKVSESR